MLCKHEMKHPLTQQLEYWARRSSKRIENTQTISQLFWSDNMHCYSFIAMNPYLKPLIHIFILIKHYSGLVLYWCPVCFNKFITWFDIYSLCSNLLYRTIQAEFSWDPKAWYIKAHLPTVPCNHLTQVRSVLSTLVNNWRTNWLLYSRLDWCDSDDVSSTCCIAEQHA